LRRGQFKEKILLNPDYRDMLCMLNEEGAEYFDWEGIMATFCLSLR
jgi:hypothetical protein